MSGKKDKNPKRVENMRNIGKSSKRGKNPEWRIPAQDIREILGDYKAQGIGLQDARFTAEYITSGMNQTEAFRRAVNPEASPDAAHNGGLRYMKRPGVKKCLAWWMSAFLGEKQEKFEYQIIETLEAQAFWDPMDFFGTDGEFKVKDWKKLSKWQRMAVQGMVKKFPKDGPDDGIIEVKMAERGPALEKLAKYISLFASDEGSVVTIPQELQDRLGEMFKQKPNAKNLPPSKRPGEKEKTE